MPCSEPLGTGMKRRDFITLILLLGPALDANYQSAKTNAAQWKEGRIVSG